jgi:hypothetical protein
LRNGHVDDAMIVPRIVIAGEEHIHRHRGELHHRPLFTLFRRTEPPAAGQGRMLRQLKPPE